MAVTNQQLADLMSEYVRATTAHTEAFVKSIDRIIENDNRHHDQFRSRMGDMALAQADTKAKTDRNSEYREKAAKYFLGGIGFLLLTIGTAVLSLIMN